jgi:hypothetical protein
MLDIWQFPLSAYEIIGSRLNDDLECAKCGDVGPILIVQIRVPGIYDGMHDLCEECARRLGLVW